MKRTWNLVPVLQRFMKVILVYIYRLAKFGGLMSCGSKDILKNAPCLMHDITDLVNHGLVKNTKHWISWEQNRTFLQKKKILNLCLRCHILRSYCFVAEVTFKVFVIFCYTLLYFIFLLVCSLCLFISQKPLSVLLILLFKFVVVIFKFFCNTCQHKCWTNCECFNGFFARIFAEAFLTQIRNS